MKSTELSSRKTKKQNSDSPDLTRDRKGDLFVTQMDPKA